MAKSDETKQKLFETALQLFSEKGFDQTTMRQIAQKAQVAPGAIYYYYPSKESVVQDYYEQIHLEHEKIVQAYFKQEKKFEKRLHKVIRSQIEIALPHKDMALALFRVASNPESPLSPFSSESKKLRLKTLALFEELVESSSDSFHKDIKLKLPSYLWFYQMGIILFWIYDYSKNSQKTFDLIDQTVPFIQWSQKNLQSPLAAPFRKKIILMLSQFELETR